MTGTPVAASHTTLFNIIAVEDSTGYYCRAVAARCQLFLMAFAKLCAWAAFFDAKPGNLLIINYFNFINIARALVNQHRWRSTGRVWRQC